ncbi:hypothetical protein TSOC_001142 [Tetrabaena socialis]|uniref:Uncharacterized protein n=1 Tax=Tetrabaena socialis TaxID=47790 RepID=A0A2J8AHI3_9CHLO|nr:hypothetical protein TSOC_001142 [Tetrabaena socialis]|eukprot:PNH11966.1 hypothetical protein TSOC_001142 [Tetrabaena socialis]
MSAGGSRHSIARLLLLLLPCCRGAPAPPLMDTLLASSRLVDSAPPGSPAEAALLSHLADIARIAAAHQPILQHPYFSAVHLRAARFTSDLLRAYPALDEHNFDSWAQRATGFLAAYARGTRPVLQGGVRVEVPLPAFGGLPLLRRVLMAQLAAGWLVGLGRRLSERAAEAAEGLVRLLYDIHRESVVQRGVLEYLHISKSGGTSWHEAAGRNGCVHPDTLGKHVRGFGDEVRWVDQQVYRNLSRGSHSIL